MRLSRFCAGTLLAASIDRPVFLGTSHNSADLTQAARQALASGLTPHERASNVADGQRQELSRRHWPGSSLLVCGSDERSGAVASSRGGLGWSMSSSTRLGETAEGMPWLASRSGSASSHCSRPSTISGPRRIRNVRNAVFASRSSARRCCSATASRF